MKNIKEALGQRVRKIRKEKKLTQEILSELLDLSPRQLIRIENGTNFPSAETLSKISLVLGVELKSLFDFESNEDVMYLATGTYNKPVLRLVKKNETALLKHCKQTTKKLEVPKSLPLSDSDDLMLKLAKKTKKPITVEYFDRKRRFAIKTFYPNGKIEDILTEKAVLTNDKYNYVFDKLKEISANPNQLEFVKLAIESLENKNNLTKLKNIIQGMELMFSIDK